MTRPSFDEIFMDMAHTSARRSTCTRRAVGALLVLDNDPITVGYNGAPRGLPHGCDVGCYRDKMGLKSGECPEVCCCVHAEQNCISLAARAGKKTDGATLYCTDQPCRNCYNAVYQAGIARVVYERPYTDKLSNEMQSTLVAIGVAVESVYRDPAFHLATHLC